MDRLVSLLNSKPMRVILRGILAPLSQLFIICLLPFLYLAEPFYRIRFGTVYSQRIGHLAINADTFLRRLKAEGWPPRTHYFFFGFDASNQQLFEMWQRLQVPGFRMIESKWGTRLMFAWRPILTRTRFWEKYRMSNTEYALYQDRTPSSPSRIKRCHEADRGLLKWVSAPKIGSFVFMCAMVRIFANGGRSTSTGGRKMIFETQILIRF